MRAFKYKGKKFSKSTEGGAIWSLSADSEIRLLTVNIIKTIADRLKSPKAACALSSKTFKQMLFLKYAKNFLLQAA